MSIRAKLSAAIVRLVDEAFDELQDEIVAKLVGAAGGAAVKRFIGEHAGPSPRASRGVANLAKGQKRDPKDIAALTEELFAYIKKNPGERIEPIAKGMGVTTRELNLPVKKLIAAKRVTTKGQKRSTTYTARRR